MKSGQKSKIKFEKLDQRIHTVATVSASMPPAIISAEYASHTASAPARSDLMAFTVGLSYQWIGHETKNTAFLVFGSKM